LTGWNLCAADQQQPVTTSGELQNDLLVAMGRSFEFRLPLAWFGPAPLRAANGPNSLRLKVSFWRNRLPVDALPEEGWIELHLQAEDEWQA
jgi:hypothetical protein